MERHLTDFHLQIRVPLYYRVRALQPLVDQVFELVPHVKHFYSDGLAAYRELVYRQGRHVAKHHSMNDKS